MSSIIKKQQLLNDHLFELNSDELEVNEAMFFFLKNKFPWEVLGGNLMAFLNQVISIVPLKERIKGTIMANVVLADDNIVIEEGATVYPGAYISGPTYICSGAIIGHGAFVRGGVFLDSNALIGHCSEVKGSIFLYNAKAPHFNYVGDSILGVDVNLGAGVKTANLRFDKKEVLVKVDGELIKTGLTKFGAIFANGTQAGCNSVTNPGTIVMPGANILPSMNVHGVIFQGS